MKPRALAFAITLLGLVPASTLAKFKQLAAVFPLGGNAPADLRQHVGFSLRMKLDRDGHYQAIDGPTIADDTGDTRITINTSPATLKPLVSDESPAVLIWGQLDGDTRHSVLKLKTLDLRKPTTQPTEVNRPINAPTDVRFAVEAVLRSLSGIKPFAHPSESSVDNNPALGAEWKHRRNLLPDGDFATGKPWTALLRLEVYPPLIVDQPPARNRIVIVAETGHPSQHVLVMNLSKGVAESNGLACLSGPIATIPAAHYRLRFEYQSDGPRLHVFVKGYVPWKNMAGQADEKQTYERQVPPTGSTHGHWRTITCDLNPTIAPQPPTVLRVDLYAYLHPGIVRFRNVELKRLDMGK